MRERTQIPGSSRPPYKGWLIFLVTIVAILLIILCILPLYPAGFSTYVFRPFQHLRNIIFNNIPFSLGDILYAAGGIAIVAIAIKWLYFLFWIKRYKEVLTISILRTLSAASVIYMVFLLGWGSNYYKPSLSESWGLADTSAQSDSAYYSFDTLLINRLNRYAAHYHPASFGETGTKAAQYYLRYSRHPEQIKGLKIKVSLFGEFLQYMGVQGYFNPFTGEAQGDSYLPEFMQPFVICHELAHQAGVAAEDDANLMAYAIGTQAADSSFNYSCYFNLWLYTHSRVRMIDSTVAKGLYRTLNPITVAHIDTLRALNKRYRSKLSHLSHGWYDKYLRMQHVKNGIESYDDVVGSAYMWERRRSVRKDSLIMIP
ncbi:MAG: DUF3810 family protein [Bacteroidetes bacterium]|nr:DUF3810 family protein [Bacteroidota bacterium]